MKSKSQISAADERDIALVVDETIARGSISEAQVDVLIGRESALRNAPQITARLRASGMQFAA